MVDAMAKAVTARDPKIETVWDLLGLCRVPKGRFLELVARFVQSAPQG